LRKNRLFKGRLGKGGGKVIFRLGLKKREPHSHFFEHIHLNVFLNESTEFLYS